MRVLDSSKCFLKYHPIKQCNRNHGIGVRMAVEDDQELNSRVAMETLGLEWSRLRKALLTPEPPRPLRAGRSPRRTAARL